MKKNLQLAFATLFCFSSNLSFSQLKVEQITSNIEFKEAEFHENMLGVYGDFLYSVRISTSGKGITYFLEKFNKSDLTKIAAFPIGKFNHEKAIAGIYPLPNNQMLIKLAIKNNILSVFYHVNENYTKRHYMVDSYNLNNGAQISNQKLLFSVDITRENFRKMDAICSISPDSAKIAIINEFGNYNDEVPENNLCIYDMVTNKAIVTKKMANMYESKKIYLNTFCVDNNANLYYTFYYGGGISFLSKYNAVTDKADVMSLKCTAMGNIIKIDDKQNNLYIYRENYIRERIENTHDYSISQLGVYSAKIDLKSFTLMHETLNLFKPDIVSRLICNKNEVNIGLYTNVKLYEIANDEYFFVWDSHSNYYAGEIIVSKLNSKLELVWSKIIPRAISPRFELGVEDHSKSLFICENNKLSILFLEHPKFALKDLDFNSLTNCETPASLTIPSTNVASYTISDNGIIKKEILFENKKDWILFDSQPVKKADKKYILRFRISGRKEGLGILTVN